MAGNILKETMKKSCHVSAFLTKGLFNESRQHAKTKRIEKEKAAVQKKNHKRIVL